MVEIKKFIGQNKGKLAVGVAGTALGVIFANSLWNAYQSRNNHEVQPTQPQTALSTGTSVPQIETQAGPTPFLNQQTTDEQDYTGPCWSLPGLDGTRISVEIGQASRYWGAVCIGVAEDGATHWWFEGHESVTYPFSPESPTAIPH